MSQLENLDLGRSESETVSATRRSFTEWLKVSLKLRKILIPVQLVVGVVVPIGVGVGINLATSGNGKKELGGWILVIFIAVIQAFLVAALVFAPDVPVSVVTEYDRLLAERVKLKEHNESITQLGLVFQGATYCAAEAVKRAQFLAGTRAGSPIMYEKELSIILEPYMDAQHQAFGFFNPHGRFRITVFMLCEDLTYLCPVCSLREKNVQARKRKLRREGSHAGQAIRTATTKLTRDAREAREFLDLYDDHDAENYVSMASTPIWIGDRITGAITVSCDVPRQFDQKGVEDVFDVLGGIISIYLSSRECNAEVNSVRENAGRQVAGDPTSGDSN